MELVLIHRILCVKIQFYGFSSVTEFFFSFSNYCTILFLDFYFNNSRYVIGKAEGEGKLWHGHVTAVSVSLNE